LEPITFSQTSLGGLDEEEDSVQHFSNSNQSIQPHPMAEAIQTLNSIKFALRKDTAPRQLEPKKLHQLTLTEMTQFSVLCLHQFAPCWIQFDFEGLLRAQREKIVVFTSFKQENPFELT
jgi:hypothetical protein